MLWYLIKRLYCRFKLTEKNKFDIIVSKLECINKDDILQENKEYMDIDIFNNSILFTKWMKYYRQVLKSKRFKYSRKFSKKWLKIFNKLPDNKINPHTLINFRMQVFEQEVLVSNLHAINLNFFIDTIIENSNKYEKIELLYRNKELFFNNETCHYTNFLSKEIKASKIQKILESDNKH